MEVILNSCLAMKVSTDIVIKGLKLYLYYNMSIFGNYYYAKNWKTAVA